MSTGTQERVEIEHLDFDPPCEARGTGEHSAGWFVACRGCGNGAFVCGPHLAAWEHKIDIDVARGAVVVCARCHRRAPSFAEAVEVLPL